MLAQIFANGPFTEADAELCRDSPTSLVIGVDGGTAHCERLAIKPDVILGDFDSIPPDLLTRYKKEDIEVSSFPPRKDATDLELALDLAAERNADSIDIFFALGGRWDMTLANLLIAANEKYRQIRIRLLSEGSRIEILWPGHQYELQGVSGQRFSLLPINGPVSRVNMHGCEYPLEDTNITFGSTLGLSNIFSSTTINLSFAEGVLAFVLSPENKTKKG